MTKSKVVTVGTVAPEFRLPHPGPVDANAQPGVVSLRQQRESGHVVLYFMRAFH